MLTRRKFKLKPRKRKNKKKKKKNRYLRRIGMYLIRKYKYITNTQLRTRPKFSMPWNIVLKKKYTKKTKHIA